MTTTAMTTSPRTAAPGTARSSADDAVCDLVGAIASVRVAVDRAGTASADAAWARARATAAAVLAHPQAGRLYRGWTQLAQLVVDTRPGDALGFAHLFAQYRLVLASRLLWQPGWMDRADTGEAA
jgi:hypothetical protein